MSLILQRGRESKHNFTTTMTWPKIVVTKIIKIRRSRHIQEIDFVVHAAYELLDLIKIMVRQVVDKWFCETHYKKINMTHCKEAPKERERDGTWCGYEKFMTPSNRFKLLIFLSLFFFVIIIISVDIVRTFFALFFSCTALEMYLVECSTHHRHHHHLHNFGSNRKNVFHLNELITEFKKRARKIYIKEAKWDQRGIKN